MSGSRPLPGDAQPERKVSLNGSGTASQASLNDMMPGWPEVDRGLDVESNANTRKVKRLCVEKTRLEREIHDIEVTLQEKASEYTDVINEIIVQYEKLVDVLSQPHQDGSRPRISRGRSTNRSPQRQIGTLGNSSGGLYAQDSARRRGSGDYLNPANTEPGFSMASLTKSRSQPATPIRSPSPSGGSAFPPRLHSPDPHTRKDNGKTYHPNAFEKPPWDQRSRSFRSSWMDRVSGPLPAQDGTFIDEPLSAPTRWPGTSPLSLGRGQLGRWRSLSRDCQERGEQAGGF